MYRIFEIERASAGSTTKVAPSQNQFHSLHGFDASGPRDRLCSSDCSDVARSNDLVRTPEAASELVIRSGHSVQSDPRTARDVRRILLVHLREAFPKGCLPVDAHLHRGEHVAARFFDYDAFSGK